MAKRMLIDATHPEETRVVVVKGNRLEEFDFETSTKLPLKGNIYLAKVVRVEPSLQAAFVEYGGNRHGFLAFGEIHPDYYQIPIADRKALLARQAAEDAAAEAAEAAEEESDLGPAGADSARADNMSSPDRGNNDNNGNNSGENAPVADPAAASPGTAADDTAAAPAGEAATPSGAPSFGASPDDGTASTADTGAGTASMAAEAHVPSIGEPGTADADADGVLPGAAPRGQIVSIDGAGSTPGEITSVGGDDFEEEAPRRSSQPYRSYKIQEVIKRRQILLIQVVKEERGNKGAALTTFISLAGRYCVLMPNTPRGGGISRKIVSAADRKRLKAIVSDLEVPPGMGVILRTAGLDRSKAEIKRDFEYLVRLWDNVRELTLRSTAPCLVYEEGSLIKRAIRDYYSGEIEEILIEGDEGYRVAKDFMRMLMPSHAKKVQPYRDQVHLFHRYQVEQQFDSMYSPTVQLRSGGYIVINPTEALVSIDVNSGKSTREHNIEETAYKTNLEAAEEIARQLRLRDLAGLIVIDFIDMQDPRNNRNVERRLKDSLKSDRARIQVGRISAFGLMEMSRQRLRPSLLESSTEICKHCEGLGYRRSTESTALYILRAIEDEGIRDRSGEITVHVAAAAALYLLNQKRDSLLDIETRYHMRVLFEPDDSLLPPNHTIERRKPRTPSPEATHPVQIESVTPADIEPEDEAEIIAFPAAAPPDHAAADTAGTVGDEGGEQRRRRRRRRRHRPGDDGPPRGQHDDGFANETGATPDGEPREFAAPAPLQPTGTTADATAAGVAGAEAAGATDSPAGPATAPGSAEDDESHRRRRRGRRGGRRRRRDEEPGNEMVGTAIGQANGLAPLGDEQPEIPPGAFGDEPPLTPAMEPEPAYLPLAIAADHAATIAPPPATATEDEVPAAAAAPRRAPRRRRRTEPTSLEPAAPADSDSAAPFEAPASAIEPSAEPPVALPIEQPQPAPAGYGVMPLEAPPLQNGELTPPEALAPEAAPTPDMPAAGQQAANGATTEPPSPPRRGWWRR